MADSQELSSSSWSAEGLVISKEEIASEPSAGATAWAAAVALRPVIRKQKTPSTPIQRMAAPRKSQYRPTDTGPHPFVRQAAATLVSGTPEFYCGVETTDSSSSARPISGARRRPWWSG